jgi:hypothetical protein
MFKLRRLTLLPRANESAAALPYPSATALALKRPKSRRRPLFLPNTTSLLAQAHVRLPSLQ